ncbi:phosphotriesterase family protein [Streptomyces mirabilis]
MSHRLVPPGVREQIARNWHYTHLHDHVLPALLQGGVTQAQLDTMLVDNPRRYFSPAKFQRHATRRCRPEPVQAARSDLVAEATDCPLAGVGLP